MNSKLATDTNLDISAVPPAERRDPGRSGRDAASAAMARDEPSTLGVVRSSSRTRAEEHGGFGSSRQEQVSPLRRNLQRASTVE